MITIYTTAYNEEVFLQFMIDHYKLKFPGCHIVLYDNESTDNTKDIAIKNNCEVIDFCSNNEIDETKVCNIKNNCWKSAKTDWVLICDVDELLNISKDNLCAEENVGTTIISSTGYSLINMNDNFDFHNITYGVRDARYDKKMLFNKKFIHNINYNAGAHSCSPQGTIQYSSKEYVLYHYKYLNIEYHKKRNMYTFNRLSDINKKHGWGTQWHINDKQVEQLFTDIRSQATKVIP